MKTEEALQVLNNVAEAASKAGLLNLNDAVVTVQALAIIREAIMSKQIKITKEEE